MKRYRNEWKYECNEMEKKIIENKISSILPLDSHSNSDGIYIVHNLYFDDYNNTCAKMTEAGDIKRLKWRIRYYNNDISNIKLELKEKLYGRCHKESCIINMDEYNALVTCDTSYIWKTDKMLVRRLFIDMMNRCFRPKVIIEYERVAYVESNLNIRITFDKNISSSYEIDKFLKRDYIKLPINNSYILEVKFDDILPGYIKALVDFECKNQMAFSKYYNGRKALEMIR